MGKQIRHQRISKKGKAFYAGSNPIKVVSDKSFEVRDFYKVLIGEPEELKNIINKVPISQKKPHFIRRAHLQNWEPGMVVLVKGESKSFPLKSQKIGAESEFYHSYDKKVNADQIVCAMEHLIDLDYVCVVDKIKSAVDNGQTEIVFSDSEHICLNLLLQSSWYRSKGYRKHLEDHLKVDERNLIEKLEKIKKSGKNIDMNNLNCQIETLRNGVQDRAKEVHCQKLIEKDFIFSLMLRGMNCRFSISFSKEPCFYTSDSPSVVEGDLAVMAISPHILIKGFYNKKFDYNTPISLTSEREFLAWNKQMEERSVEYFVKKV